MVSGASAEPPAAAGAMVMAIGIFLAAALQRLPGGPSVTRPLGVLLALLWAALAALILRAIGRRGLSFYAQPTLPSFGIGTWVAGTAIVAQAMMLALPADRWFASGLFLAALALWLVFVPLAVRNLVLLAMDATLRPTGLVLLPTVATQAIALVAPRLFPASVLIRGAAAALMAAGAAFYLVGTCLVIRRYVFDGARSLTADWDNSNCILHGALSITGLAAVVSGSVGPSDILALWALVLAIFAVVEAIEILRGVARVGLLGLRSGLCVYDVSQWARNFTFGMLYAFTLAFSERFAIGGAHPLLAMIRAAILAWGPYAVLLFLLAELLLLVHSGSLVRRG